MREVKPVAANPIRPSFQEITHGSVRIDLQSTPLELRSIPAGEFGSVPTNRGV